MKSDAGPASVTLLASPNAAGLVSSTTAVSISTTPTVVKVHATAQSASRGDATIQDQTVVVATPTYWGSQKIWYIDVSVSHTQANEGIMGFIAKDSWLPRLRNGTDVGPMPAGLHGRYVTLYHTFSNSWRVTHKTSLFVYALGTSTKTFTDLDWPTEKAPCKLKPAFQVPGVSIAKSMPIAEAKQICRVISDKGLYNSCVFDVATTGDKLFCQEFPHGPGARALWYRHPD